MKLGTTEGELTNCSRGADLAPGTNNRHGEQSSKIGQASASTFQPALHPEFQPANTAQRGQNGNENALNENKYRNTERGQSKMTIGIEKRQ